MSFSVGDRIRIIDYPDEVVVPVLVGSEGIVIGFSTYVQVRTDESIMNSRFWLMEEWELEKL